MALTTMGRRLDRILGRLPDPRCPHCGKSAKEPVALSGPAVEHDDPVSRLLRRLIAREKGTEGDLEEGA